MYCYQDTAADWLLVGLANGDLHALAFSQRLGIRRPYTHTASDSSARISVVRSTGRMW